MRKVLQAIVAVIACGILIGLYYAIQPRLGTVVATTSPVTEVKVESQDVYFAVEHGGEVFQCHWPISANSRSLMSIQPPAFVLYPVGSNLLFGSGDGLVGCLDVQKDSRIWERYVDGTRVMSLSRISEDGVLYCGYWPHRGGNFATPGEIVALNAHDGSRIGFVGRMNRVPVLIDENTDADGQLIMAVDMNGKVRAWEREGKSAKWRDLQLARWIDEGSFRFLKICNGRQVALVDKQGILLAGHIKSHNPMRYAVGANGQTIIAECEWRGLPNTLCLITDTILQATITADKITVNTVYPGSTLRLVPPPTCVDASSKTVAVGTGREIRIFEVNR